MQSLKGMHRLTLKTTVRERLHSLYAAVKLAPGTRHSGIFSINRGKTTNSQNPSQGFQ